MSWLLTVAVLVPVTVVVMTVFMVLWREQSSPYEARIAMASGASLGVWALVATVLSYRGFFRPRTPVNFPPIGINLVVVLLILAGSLIGRARCVAY